jgi:hypothetical protein
VDDGTDRHANLDARVVGAFGGMHRHPHGEVRPTTDITAADLHTLCDIYTHVAESTPLGLLINFHFDYEGERVRIETNRDKTGLLTVWPKTAQPVCIRIPAWTPRESVQLTVNGQANRPIWLAGFLFVPKHQVGDRIEVKYELPVSTTDESADGTMYRLTWRGDEVIGIAPNTDFLPFYPTSSHQAPRSSGREGTANDRHGLCFR